MKIKMTRDILGTQSNEGLGQGILSYGLIAEQRRQGRCFFNFNFESTTRGFTMSVVNIINSTVIFFRFAIPILFMIWNVYHAPSELQLITENPT
jgi:hypothetical protein